MALHSVDTRTSVSYCAVGLGPNPVVQDGVTSIADRGWKKGQKRRGPNNTWQCVS